VSRADGAQRSLHSRSESITGLSVSIAYLLQHAVTRAQVSTASFLPVVFVVALVLTIPRGRGFDHDGVVREVAA
jgi:hypothetical protein